MKNSYQFTLLFVLIFSSAACSQPPNNAKQVLKACGEDASGMSQVCAKNHLVGFPKKSFSFGGHRGGGFDGSVMLHEYALDMKGHAIISQANVKHVSHKLKNGYIPFSELRMGGYGDGTVDDKQPCKPESFEDKFTGISMTNMVLYHYGYMNTNKSTMTSNFLDTPFFELNGKDNQFIDNHILYRNIAKSNTDVSKHIAKKSTLLSLYQGELPRYDFESEQDLYDHRQDLFDKLKVVKLIEENRLNEARKLAYIWRNKDGDIFVEETPSFGHEYKSLKKSTINYLAESNLPTTALLVTCAPNAVIDGNTFTAKVKGNGYAIVLKNSPNVRITNNTFNGFDVPVLMDSKSSIIDDKGNIINKDILAGAKATFDKTGKLSTTDKVNYGKPEDYYPK